MILMRIVLMIYIYYKFCEILDTVWFVGKYFPKELGLFMFIKDDIMSIVISSLLLYIIR